jgi:acetyl/propionyl-CoA carboxylase alpha subunit
VPDRTLTLRDESGRLYTVVRRDDETFDVNGTDTSIVAAVDGSLVHAGEERHVLWAVRSGATCWVFVEGEVFTFELEQPGRRTRPRATEHGPIASPMPATVRRIAVASGDAVRRGDVLVVLEAMKMELPIRASGDGRVEAVSCREGELVEAGRELIRIG